LESTVPTSRSAYAVAKRTGEEIVAAAATEALRALSVRLGYIYGLDERSRATRLDVSLVRRWADCVARSEPIVVRTPDALRDWTFAGDLAAAIDAALRTGPAVPLIHLGSGEIVTDLELARAVTAAAGRGEVIVDPAPGAPKSKAPMGSLHRLEVRWTALRDALTSIVAESVAA
jgi:UDP-glucose 4-epimerase